MELAIGVDCNFEEDGRVRLQRVRIDGKWQPVEQGRQWLDESGRHVLIMLGGQGVREILLDSRTLQWRLLQRRANPPIV
jgi:hypothetical protein